MIPGGGATSPARHAFIGFAQHLGFMEVLPRLSMLEEPSRLCTSAEPGATLA